MSGAARVVAIVTGRVQGVAFRAATAAQAQQLGGLTGWVRNLPDGSVEIVAEGARERVEALLAWARRGPPAARVAGVQASWGDPRGDLPPFDISF